MTARRGSAMQQPNTNVETGRVSSWRHHLLYYWIATGVVVGYAFSAVMTIGGLNVHELNIIYITTVFIPVSHCLSLYGCKPPT
jgi:membrane glycosyltransferase